jgi:hypothetical protein
MSDLVNRDINELTTNGNNYLSWSLDVEIVLGGKDFLRVIKPTKDKTTTSVERVQFKLYTFSDIT